MEHPLAEAHREGRRRLLDLGRGLDGDGAATITTACPEWTIKDVYAHLAGISTDILIGNTEQAATPEWADGHVADRKDQSLAEVLDEWTDAGAQVDELLAVAGEAFPFQLFLDQWTHEWDIRAALGALAAAAPDLAVCEYVLDMLAEWLRSHAPSGEGQLVVAVTEPEREISLGDGDPLGVLPIGLFEFTRVTMGRRSQAQLDALAWPDAITDRSPWIDTMVVWSINSVDVSDPVAV